MRRYACAGIRHAWRERCTNARKLPYVFEITKYYQAGSSTRGSAGEATGEDGGARFG
jgi:hypothetical protein